MLKEIKKLFNEHKKMNVEELANHFQVPESSIEGMLQLLIQKNVIEKNELECHSCGCGCGSCSSASPKTVYSLVDPLEIDSD